MTTTSGGVTTPTTAGTATSDSSTRGLASIGSVSEPPFHAVEIRSGTLGTKGGARTDADGRVLDAGGDPIAGLYAAGNAMAAVTAMVYGGGGGTLGPAVVFGYRCRAPRGCLRAVGVSV